jgi:hypothetical protein
MMPLDDPRVDAAIAELQALIRAQFPETTFSVGPGEDPVGMYITATSDVDDLDEVIDVVVERLLEMQVDEGLPVYVIPVHPIERVYAELHAPDPVGARIALLLG